MGINSKVQDQTENKEEDLQRDLYEAVEKNDTSWALDLLEKGVPCNYIDAANKSRWTILHWAAYHGNQKVVDALLKAEIDSHFEVNEEKNATMKAKTETLGTPLHRAAQRGHLSVCWMLLLSGCYSTEDVDNIGNTALHVCAAHGHEQVLRCFINNGADVGRKNIFHNTAYDVAKTTACKRLLGVEMEKPGSDDNVRRDMHLANLSRYLSAKDRIIALVESSQSCELEDVKTAVEAATAIGVATEVIKLGEQRLQWIEIEQSVNNHISRVKERTPITTSLKYSDVLQLHQSLKMMEDACNSVPPFLRTNDTIIKEGRLLCERSHDEYRLALVSKRLSKIECATEKTTHDIERLRKSLQKAEQSRCDPELLKKASDLKLRLMSEIDLQLACDEWPKARLPVPEMTPREQKEYWREEDIGHVERTAEYPLPPSDTGEYIWISSNSLSLLRNKIVIATQCMERAERRNGSERLIARCKKIIEEKIKERTILQEKEDKDRAEALIEVQKERAKLRRKKKKNQTKAKLS